MKFNEVITTGCERIHIIEMGYDVESGFQNKYCSMQIIRDLYLIVCIHLPSNLYADNDMRRVAIATIIDEIHNYETNIGIDKIIIVGDFNENPYDLGCLGADGFHALPSYETAKRGYRIVIGKKFKMFYNPMWNLMGDFSFPPLTYYYQNNNLVNPFWYIYDQVLISPNLRESFINEELNIDSVG